MDTLVGGGCSAWKVFLDLRPDSDLLVLGTDLERLVDNLAPNVGQLFALDFDNQGLRSEKLTSIRGASENNPLVVVDGSLELPFADDCMDCVVLSGVLEYIAREAASPRAMQQKLFCELRRVIKPMGQIFFGSDNRLSYERFRRGNVVQLLFDTLFRHWRKDQAHEHSFPGYRLTLKNAGFPQCEFLGLMKAGSFVTEIVPQDGDFHGWQAHERYSWLDRLKRSQLFVPAYGVIASARPMPWTSLEQRIFNVVSEGLGGEQEATGALNVHKYEITGKQKLVAHASTGQKRLLIKHTFHTQSTQSERNNFAILTWLSEHRPALAAVPRPITSGEISKQVFFAETAVHGRPLKHIVQGVKRVEVVKAGMSFLRRINPPETADHVNFDGALFEEYVGKRLAGVLPLLKEPAHQQHLLAFFHKHFLGKTFFLGVAHGDFSSSNILFDGNEISGVFDWEAGSVRNVSALDGISLLISIHRAAGAKLTLAECLSMLAGRQWPVSAEFSLLMDLYDFMGIDEDCHAGIVYLSWLNGMGLRLRYGMDQDPAAVQTYIHDVVARIGLG